jgi:hypothetical protein|tara:strand:+ start:1090 stop:1944 length:855 start_codon:yes stop_codon:yes gene_type:complete
MLEKNLSVIQCHILFDDERGKKRLEHQKSFKGIPSFGKIFEDCNFYVNYKTEVFLEDIKETYEKYIKNIHLFNNLEGPDFNWVAVKLLLVRESKTPYIMFSTEDRMFHKTDKEEFERIMQDIIDNDVQYMPIGKLDHLTVGSRYETVEELMSPTQVHGKTCIKKYKDSGKELFLFKAEDSPVKITSFSADAIYKRELIIDLLEDMVNVYGLKPYSPNSKLSQNTSKYFEDYYTDMYGKGVRQQGSMMCAVPKRELVISDETPGEELGTLKETPKEVLEYDVRQN